MGTPRRMISAAIMAGASLLAGCEMPVNVNAPQSAIYPEAAPRSPESQALEGYYASVQRSLVTQGLLRTDGGGPDVPFSSRNLVQNFLRIALYEEHQVSNGQLVSRQKASRLHRWEQPVQMSVSFGASIAPEQRRRDSADIARFANRLARLTGLSITQVNTGGNYRVLILNEDERRAIGPELRRLMPGINRASVNAIVNMSRTTYCLVIASDSNNDGTYGQAVAIIRGEHPDLLRRSCIQEELAQGLGLPNDSPAARPSIFNDDEEFGLLTDHDELLLKMLYDPRLRPGMTERQARPVVETIAAELIGGTV